MTASALARWAGAVLAIGYGLPALGALLLGIASVPFGMIFALGLLPCGWTLPFAGPYLNLTAEPAPPAHGPSPSCTASDKVRSARTFPCH